MRSSGWLFALSVLFLLSFQGWLSVSHGVKYADLPMVDSSRETRSEVRWVRTGWIAEVLEEKFFELSERRRLVIECCGGNTVLDSAVQLNSVTDFLMYLPRALQVGLLSPMPGLWGGEGSSPAMTLARKIVGMVTCLFYVCLIGLSAGVFLFRRNLSLWIIFVFCLLGILVYSFTYPNVGTLMRYRYGFHMTLISFGAAVVLEQVLDWRQKRRPNGQASI